MEASDPARESAVPRDAQDLPKVEALSLPADPKNSAWKVHGPWWLLYFGLFLVQLALAVAVSPANDPSVPMVAFFSLSFGLLNAWGVVQSLGRFTLLERIVSVIWLWAVVSAVFLGLGRPEAAVFVLLLTHFVALVFPLLTVRFLLGLRLEALSSDVAKSAPDALQFRLIHLFYWMFAAALLLGLGKALSGILARWLNSVSFDNFLLLGFVWGFVQATLGLTACWAMLGRGRWPLRVPIVLGLSLAGGLLVALIRGSFVETFLGLFVTQAILLALGLLLFRLRGFRLVRTNSRFFDSSPHSLPNLLPDKPDDFMFSTK